MKRKNKIIKVLAAVSLFIFLSFSLAYAETIHYNDQKFDPGFNLLNQHLAGVEIRYSVPEVTIDDIVIDGQRMQNILISGIFLPNDAGAPNLPGEGRMIAIPQGAMVEYRIISSETELIENIDVAPAPPIPFENDDSPPVYEKNMLIYSNDKYYPENPVIISEPSKIRGVDYVIIGITPFQYNPVTRQLIVYKNLEIEIDFVGGNGRFGDDRLRSRFWEPVLQSNLINYNSLNRVDFDARLLVPSETDDFEYLIIVPDDPLFTAWADTIRNWRTLQGIKSGVVTLTQIGGNTTTAIENYINNAYNTWDIPPAAVLLLSDYENSGLTYGITSPFWDNYCVSDNIYADVDGNDLPDITFSRMTARNSNDLSIMINKFLSYERNPPISPSFYNQPITAGGWQTERWFILCTEICWGFMNSVLGKNPVREYAIYSGTPGSVWSSNQNTSMLVNYFGPSGLGYIPSTPAHLNDWGANATRINSDINSGSFLMLHRDHGFEQGWGEPDYTSSDLSGLDNSYLPFVLSINCLTGRYNYGTEVFAEAFHRMSGGALGLIAASEISYSFVNDTYIFGLFDYMWPNFDPGHGASGDATLNPAFANASAKYYLEASNWPYNPQHKDYTHHLFHHHGDAFNTIYSEIPQNLSITHDPVLLAGVGSFMISADQGALIGLTVNNEIIGRSEGTGSPEPIIIAPQLPGDNMVVTVTKPNYYRYSVDVSVITTNGPYVIFDSCAIDDIAGNNNGFADLGEEISLDLQLKNVGSDTAFSVSAQLNSTDPYVTITDNSENYGMILDNDGTAFIAGAFSFNISTDVPDAHNLVFEIVVTDNRDSTWSSNFIIPACAPQLEIQAVVINDSSGNNNGVLDPGESASIIVTLANSGTGQADGISAILTEIDPYVSVVDDFGLFGDLASNGGTGDNASDRYLVFALGTCPSGYVVAFNLSIDGDRGFSTDVSFDIIVGDKSVIYYDDFSSNLGWIGLGGAAEWTIGSAAGGVGGDNYGNPDPSVDHSPTTDNKVLGNDLTSGSGGDYNASISSTYWATSPTMDCSDYTGVEISFFRWLGVERDIYDNAYFQAFNGSSWITLFENGTSTFDEDSWNEQIYDISAIADGNASFKIRFGMGSTDYAWQYCGWNIDDIELKGFSQGTVNDPEILIAPSALIDTVREGEQSVNSLKIYNIGTVTLEVSFSSPAVWIECDNGLNTIVAGDSLGFDITINTSTLIPGDYSSALEFTSNDSNHLTGSVPVFVNVTQGGCEYVAGDVNNSGDYNGLDVTYSVAYFKGGAAPPFECECTTGNIWHVSGDVNNSCSYNGLDVTYGVNFFKGGPEPESCGDCPPAGAISSSLESGQIAKPAVINKPNKRKMGLAK